MNNRREFVRELLVASLLFPLLGNSKSIPEKEILVVGGQNNFLIIYDVVKKVTRKFSIGFKGHSYIQNPLKPNEVIITRKGGGNWCVFNLNSNKVIKNFSDKNMIYYGHITFAENGSRFYRPRSILGKEVVLEVVDSKTYNVIDTIPFESKILHEVRIMKGTNNLILASTGHLSQTGKEESGVVILSLDERKIIKTVKMDTEGFYPTHLLDLKDDRYVVSTEVPRGAEKMSNVKIAPDGSRDFKGAIFEVNVGAKTSSRKIALPNSLEESLKENISNFIFEEKSNLVYFESLEGRKIFLLNADSMEYVTEYPIRTHGLFLYKDKVFVSDYENNKFEKFVSVFDMSKEYLTNTHFSVFEV